MTEKINRWYMDLGRVQAQADAMWHLLPDSRAITIGSEAWQVLSANWARDADNANKELMSFESFRSECKSLSVLKEKMDYLGRRWEQLSVSEPKSVNESRERTINALRLSHGLVDVLQALEALAHAHKEFGLTPADVEQYARRYGVEMPDGPSFEVLDKIKDKVFRARIRSNVGRKKKVNDDEARSVVSTVKGRAKQAERLGLSARHVRRRIKAIEEEMLRGSGVAFDDMSHDIA